MPANPWLETSPLDEFTHPSPDFLANGGIQGSYIDEAGPDPFYLNGNQLSQELAQRGVNPISLTNAARAFSEDAGVPEEAQLHLKTQPPDDQLTLPDQYKKTAVQLGDFHAPMRVDYDPGDGNFSREVQSGLNPWYSEIRMRPGMDPYMTLQALRHEMQHAGDYYKGLQEGGPEAAIAGHETHFSGGNEKDVEPTFIRRPYLLEPGF